MVIGGAATILGPAVGALLLVLLRRNTEDLIEGKEILAPGHLRRARSSSSSTSCPRAWSAACAGCSPGSAGGRPAATRHAHGRAGHAPTRPASHCPRRTTPRRAHPSPDLDSPALAGAARGPRPGRRRLQPRATTTTAPRRRRRGQRRQRRRRRRRGRVDRHRRTAPTDPTAGDRGRHDQAGVELPAVGPHRGVRRDRPRLEGVLRDRSTTTRAASRSPARTYTIETEDKDDEYNAAEDRRRTSTRWSAPTATAPSPSFSVVGTANNLAIRDHARRAVRAEPLRRHRLAGLGQRRLPVD